MIKMRKTYNIFYIFKKLLRMYLNFFLTSYTNKLNLTMVRHYEYKLIVCLVYCINIKFC